VSPPTITTSASKLGEQLAVQLDCSSWGMKLEILSASLSKFLNREMGNFTPVVHVGGYSVDKSCGTAVPSTGAAGQSVYS